MRSEVAGVVSRSRLKETAIARDLLRRGEGRFYRGNLHSGSGRDSWRRSSDTKLLSELLTGPSGHPLEQGGDDRNERR